MFSQGVARAHSHLSRLPDQLANREALRQRVQQALADLPSRERPNRYKRPHRINLTDGDANIMKTRQGFVPGYNGHAAGFTAVDLMDNSYDNGLLVPMMEQAEEITGTKAATTLA